MGRRIHWVLGALLLVQGSVGHAAVTVSQGEYHGWAGVYRLSNGTVDLVFVPQIGRILRYGYVGERNVLWENAALAGKTTDLSRSGSDWQNYGGDKLWPSPQSAWGWPPDPISDSGAQTVKVLANRRLLVTGLESRKYGVRFQREIAMNPSGTGVTIRNTMTNVSGKVAEWGIWEVAQADDPAETELAASSADRFPGGYKIFKEMKPADGQVTIQGGTVRIRRRADHSGKIGGRSLGGWIESRWSTGRFRISADLPRSGDYPDGGCGQEVYTSDDPNRYVEMELLAPIHKLASKASSSVVTHWSLARMPSPGP